MDLTQKYRTIRLDMGEHPGREAGMAKTIIYLASRKTGGPYVIVDADGPNPQQNKAESLVRLRKRLLAAEAHAFFDWHPDTGPQFRVRKMAMPVLHDGDIVTKYGIVHYGGPCKDDYDNIVIRTIGGRDVKLQLPAMEAFQAACDKLGRAIQLTGSWRSCAYQTELYNSDHNRYAPPDVTAHTRGLAIDVSTVDPAFSHIHDLLLAEGWTQARPDDEKWHYSYGPTV